MHEGCYMCEGVRNDSCVRALPRQQLWVGNRLSQNTRKQSTMMSSRIQCRGAPLNARVSVSCLLLWLVTKKRGKRRRLFVVLRMSHHLCLKSQLYFIVTLSLLTVAQPAHRRGSVHSSSPAPDQKRAFANAVPLAWNKTILLTLTPTPTINLHAPSPTCHLTSRTHPSQTVFIPGRLAGSPKFVLHSHTMLISGYHVTSLVLSSGHLSQGIVIIFFSSVSVLVL